MNIKIHSRWDELSPEVQLEVIRLINHLASTGETNIGENWQKYIGDNVGYRKGHADGVAEAIDHMIRFGE